MTSVYESGNAPPILVRHRLRIAREYAQLEQDELAALIGVSRNTVGNAEKGRVRPRRITINAWALACGVPATWLTDGVSQTRPPDDGGPGTSKPVGYLSTRRRPAPIIALRPTG
jgi:DNA-binding XRE family transcriptional regulator